MDRSQTNSAIEKREPLKLFENFKQKRKDDVQRTAPVQSELNKADSIVK
jgi:hypothetical protein